MFERGVLEEGKDIGRWQTSALASFWFSLSNKIPDAKTLHISVSRNMSDLYRNQEVRIIRLVNPQFSRFYGGKIQWLKANIKITWYIRQTSMSRFTSAALASPNHKSSRISAASKFSSLSKSNRASHDLHLELATVVCCQHPRMWGSGDG